MSRNVEWTGKTASGERVRRGHGRGRLLLLAAVGLALAGCSPGVAEERRGAEAASAPAADVREVVVRAFDYQFAAPDTLVAGLTRIRLVNDGPDFHHVWLVRLTDDRPLAELVERLGEHGPLPEWAVAVGGPNTPGAPGEETEATLVLEPGRYALVCVIPGMHDGELHVLKGMIRPLTVVASEAPVASALPEPDLVMTLDDYSFELDRPLRSGRQVIRVVNAAAQPHEVVVVRLEPGRTAADFLGFLQQPEGSPPGHMVGGVTWLGTGEQNNIALEFAPGRYALLCFVPDATDGQLHLAHGMIRELDVE